MFLVAVFLVAVLSGATAAVAGLGIGSLLTPLFATLLYTRFSNRTLEVVLALLLITTSIAGLTNWLQRWHPQSGVAGAFGFASGLFGGVAGNQGGLRAAALLAFPLAPAAFVATSPQLASLLTLPGCRSTCGARAARSCRS